MPDGIDSKARENRDDTCKHDCDHCQRGQRCEGLALDFIDGHPAPRPADAENAGC